MMRWSTLGGALPRIAQWHSLLASRFFLFSFEKVHSPCRFPFSLFQNARIK